MAFGAVNELRSMDVSATHWANILEKSVILEVLRYCRPLMVVSTTKSLNHRPVVRMSALANEGSKVTSVTKWLRARFRQALFSLRVIDSDCHGAEETSSPAQTF